MNSITTNCKALNWLISKTTEYLKEEGETSYRFAGSIPTGMYREIAAWMKSNGATFSDGHKSNGYGMKLSETFDDTTRRYQRVTVRISNSRSTSNVTLLINVIDEIVTDEDMESILAAM